MPISHKVVLSRLFPPNARDQMKVTLIPLIGAATFTIGSGPEVTLAGEDLGKLIAWLKEDGFKVP